MLIGLNNFLNQNKVINVILDLKFSQWVLLPWIMVQVNHCLLVTSFLMTT
jgi:hypothetical protein